MLEIGPGTGYYTLDMAEWVGPEGRVEIFDLQQEFLDHTMRRAAERGLENVVPTQGDATALPYEDASMDAVVLNAVLGEIPDPVAALREIRRVLKPGGRLVVGELFGDPHFTTQAALRAPGRRGRPRLRRGLRLLVRLRRPADAGLGRPQPRIALPAMCLRRVLSRWARLAGRPFDLATRLTSSLRSFLVRLASTRSRPFFTSQTETAQTIVQGTRFQAALALRLAIQRGMSGPA